ncbi:MAG: nucleotide sugar dehydrogenase, partial [Alphaproteobacteria bacterium]|nr:nucleotide sugar dehydrogenase [Alphaproteobacteria bacterium]
MDGLEASSLQALAGKIGSREAVVGIIGLGYVGLPLAHAVHGANYRILGFDVSADKVAMYNRGVSPIGSVSSDALMRMRQNNRFEATEDFARLNEPDIILICVPTP